MLVDFWRIFSRNCNFLLSKCIELVGLQFHPEIKIMRYYQKVLVKTFLLVQGSLSNSFPSLSYVSLYVEYKFWFRKFWFGQNFWFAVIKLIKLPLQIYTLSISMGQGAPDTFPDYYVMCSNPPGCTPKYSMIVY